VIAADDESAVGLDLLCPRMILIDPDGGRRLALAFTIGRRPRSSSFHVCQRLREMDVPDLYSSSHLWDADFARLVSGSIRDLCDFISLPLPEVPSSFFGCSPSLLKQLASDVAADHGFVGILDQMCRPDEF
jgi:hypothetical protein